MAQGQIQQLKQEQRQQQSISAQQLLQAQLIELPLQQMTDRIETELHDNPALEKSVGDDDAASWEQSDMGDSPEAADGDDYDSQREREERSDALDAALENIGRDDEDLPVYQGGHQWSEEKESAIYGEERSFYDMLMDQVGELELTQTDRFVMEYLIQSLDDDGLLRTPLDDICEQLAIYHGIDLGEQDAQRSEQDSVAFRRPGAVLCFPLFRKPPQPFRRYKEKSRAHNAQNDTAPYFLLHFSSPHAWNTPSA